MSLKLVKTRKGHKMDIKEALAGIQLSKNFTALEFCNSQDGYAIKVPDIRLFACLQSLRDKVGPIKITSGFRTKEYNAKVKGSANSNHLLGMALDVQFDFSKYNEQQLKDLAVTCGFSNLGIYYNSAKKVQWLHLDISKRWNEGNGWKHYKSIAFKVYNV